MLLLVALLMGLAVIAASVAPDPRVRSEAPAPPAQAGSASPAPGTATAPETPAEQDARDVASIPDEPPIHTIDADGKKQTVRVAVDETLRLHVTSARLESVQLGADGPIEVVTPELPARFELLVDGPLDLEVRLLESDRVIGRVTTGD
jgi:hypothetical protein